MLHAWQGRCATTMALVFLQAQAHAAPGPLSGHITGLTINALTGQAIAGAQVTAGRHVTLSDAQGRFDIDVAAAAGQTVRATFPGYATGITRLDVNEGAAALATLGLVPTHGTNTWDQGSALTAQVPGSTAQVTLPSASLVDRASGRAISGARVTAMVTPIDPSAHAAALPGSYLRGVGRQSTLPVESFGAIHLEVRDRLSGQLVGLAPGARATVRIPASSRGSAPLPATLALSHLDEASGLWLEEGMAALRGNGASLYYEGAVSRLAFWAANLPAPTIQVHGSVCPPGNGGAVNVHTDDLNHTEAAQGQVLANGSFHVSMRQGGQAMLQARSVGQSSESLLLGPSNADIELPDCLPLR
jgi:hypothetical protein